MKKKVIDLTNQMVKVETDEQAASLQYAAFRQGFFWRMNGKQIAHKKKRFFCFWSNKEITHGIFIDKEEKEKSGFFNKVIDFENVFIEEKEEPNELDLIAERIQLQNRVEETNQQITDVNKKRAAKLATEAIEKIQQIVEEYFKNGGNQPLILSDSAKDEKITIKLIDFGSLESGFNWSKSFDTEPKPGDLCYFWDEANKGGLLLRKYAGINKRSKEYIYGDEKGTNWINCKKVTNNETLQLWGELQAKQTDK